MLQNIILEISQTKKTKTIPILIYFPFHGCISMKMVGEIMKEGWIFTLATFIRPVFETEKRGKFLLEVIV